MRRVFPCLLCLFIAMSAYAQDNIDALESAILKKDYAASNVISKRLVDSELALERSYGYWALGVAYLSQDPDTAYYFLASALRESPDDLLRMKILNAQANYFDITGATRNAIKLFKEAVDLAIQHDSTFLTGVYNNLSIAYRSIEMFDSATYFGFEGLKITEKFDQRFERKRLYNSIAITYAIQGDLTLAGKYFRQSLKTAIQNSDSLGASRGYVNLTQLNIYDDQIDSAKYFLSQAEIFNAKGKNALDIMDMYALLAEVNASEDDLQAALDNLNRAITILDGLDFPTERLSLYLSLSNVYLDLGRVGNSQDKLDQAKAIAAGIESTSNSLDIAKLQKRIFVRSGMLRKALALDARIDSLTATRFSAQKAKAVEDVRERYETEKKEQQIVSLEQASKISDLKIRQQSILLLASAFLFIVILLIGYVAYRNRDLRMSKQRLLIEQKLLRSQMNPHFLFNALSSIHAFILKGEKREASDYLTTFSELTRDILNLSSSDWITLEKELATLSNYMDVQKLRFPYVSTHIEVSETIDQSNIMFPPLLLQPFVENAFEHGFKGREDGLLKILIDENEKRLSIEIKDNGVGLNFANTNHDSKAIHIASERLSLLFGKGKTKLAVENQSEEDGVIVRIEMPKQLML